MTEKRIFKIVFTPYIFKYFLRSSRIRRAYYNAIKNQNIIVRSRIDISGLKITLDIGDFIQFWIFMEGGYERDLCKFLSEFIKEKVFLDIGANIGSYSLSLCRFAHHIYAFEPFLESCRLLSENARMNAVTNITVVNKAVYNVDGMTMDLHLSRHTAGSHSLFLVDTGIDKQVDIVDIITVDSFVLKNKLNNIGAIKVDVEGSELFALSGAEETIKNNRPLIICEINSETCRVAGHSPVQLFDYISSFDYDAFCLKKGVLTKFNRQELENQLMVNMIFRPA